MKVLSLGWGVQSFTLLCMAYVGEIELDYAIHADTGFEKAATYSIAKKYTKLFGKKINILQVENLKARKTFLNSKSVMIPAFTSNGGMLFRTCTSRWKIEPIRKKIQELRKGGHAELLLGITTDEWQRMKPSRVKYITNVYPLIEKKMSRQNCVDWLKSHNFDIPSKSTCVFCPYHSYESWKEAKRNKTDWDKAIEIDEMIRNRMSGCKLFINSNRIPLANMPDQISMFDYENEECSGFCFI